jgi:hypothetical protein
MVTRRTIFIPTLLFLLAPGCATKEKPQVVQPPPHSHYYPFTQVIGDYHVRLMVNHSKGELTLIYEDISERPVKIVHSRRIKAKAILPDGTIKDVRFYTSRVPWGPRPRHYHPSQRLAGIYYARAEWVKSSPKFELTAELPLEGEYYERTFRYEVPGGEIPLYRK